MSTSPVRCHLQTPSSLAAVSAPISDGKQAQLRALLFKRMEDERAYQALLQACQGRDSPSNASPSLSPMGRSQAGDAGFSISRRTPSPHFSFDKRSPSPLPERSLGAAVVPAVATAARVTQIVPASPATPSAAQVANPILATLQTPRKAKPPTASLNAPQANLGASQTPMGQPVTPQKAKPAAAAAATALLTPPAASERLNVVKRKAPLQLQPKSAPVVVKTPQKYHAWSYIAGNIKADGQPNSKLRSLFGKQHNTFVDHSPQLKQDTATIRAKQLKPDATGEYQVKRRKKDGTSYEARYGMHGISLYPKEGEGARTLTGAQVARFVAEYSKVMHKMSPKEFAAGWSPSAPAASAAAAAASINGDH